MRLPFALFGALGLVMTWWMLARLVSRRVAWLAFAIIATCPLYVLVARQAITDMPLVAALMGAIACFAMAVHRGEQPLEPFCRRGRLRLDAHHVLRRLRWPLFTLWQAASTTFYFARSPRLAAGRARVAAGPAARRRHGRWLLAGFDGLELPARSRPARAARCGCTGSTSSSA